MLGFKCFFFFFSSSKCLLPFGPDLNLIRKTREGSEQLCKSWSRISTADMDTLAGFMDSKPSLVQADSCLTFFGVGDWERVADDRQRRNLVPL